MSTINGDAKTSMTTMTAINSDDKDDDDDDDAMGGTRARRSPPPPLKAPIELCVALALLVVKFIENNLRKLKHTLNKSNKNVA